MREKGNNTMKTTLNINDYAEQIKEEILALMMPAQKNDLNIRIETINKINDQRLIGLSFRTVDSPAAPTLYLNDAYEYHCLAGEPVSRQAEEILSRYLKAVEDGLPSSAQAFGTGTEGFELHYEAVSDRLKLRLIEISRNKEFLKDKPYRKVGNGLALIAEISGNDDSSEWSVVINSSILAEIGTDEVTLFEGALNNAPRIDEPVLFSMEDRLFGGDSNLLCEDSVLAEPTNMYVLSTESGLNGAAALFYPGIMEKAGKVIGCSYFILPSSLHEVILVPDAGAIDPSGLKYMVVEANKTVVDPHDVLSDNVFYYDRSSGIFSIYA